MQASSFGVAYNPEAIIAQDAQFNFYDGGGLDVSCLGMAYADAAGIVNVSKIGIVADRLRRLYQHFAKCQEGVFCGNFTAKGLRCTVGNGQLRIATRKAPFPSLSNGSIRSPLAATMPVSRHADGTLRHRAGRLPVDAGGTAAQRDFRSRALI
ncbi:MAG: hypothetical protein R2867_39540 [Caldilineaceae bacterium]